MGIIFSCYCFEFQDLVDVHKDLEGEEINQKDNKILTDPRYNTRFDQESQSKDNDKFNDENLEYFKTFYSKRMSRIHVQLI